MNRGCANHSSKISHGVKSVFPTLPTGCLPQTAGPAYAQSRDRSETSYWRWVPSVIQAHEYRTVLGHGSFTEVMDQLVAGPEDQKAANQQVGNTKGKSRQDEHKE